jgi:hypothetical protein
MFPAVMGVARFALLSFKDVSTAPVTAAPIEVIETACVAVATRSIETEYVATGVLVTAVAVKIDVSAEVATRRAPAAVTVKYLTFVTRSSRAVPSSV